MYLRIFACCLLFASAGVQAKEPKPPAAPAPVHATVTGPARMDLKTGLLFVWIPPGQLVFGCDAGSPCAVVRQPSTKPTAMPGFWFMRGRVTESEYGACVTAGACTPPAENQFCTRAGPSYPVTCVNYSQAEAFCSWIEARLPTAMEWEFVMDSGYNPNWDYGDDFNGQSHGATEWVKRSGPSASAPGYEPTRGGVADLEPLWPSDEGDAISGLQVQAIGFRCAQTAAP